MTAADLSERFYIALGRAWAGDDDLTDEEAESCISIDCHIQPEEVKVALEKAGLELVEKNA